MPSNQEIAAALLVLDYVGTFEKKRKDRKCWTKTWLQKRKKFLHMNPLKELKENYPDDYRNCLRMTDADFDSLLKQVSPIISKKDTNMRTSITAEERLAVTLRFLTTGRSFEDLKFSAAISAQALGRIIPETCRAIYATLESDYIKFPSTPEEWKNIASAFNDQWNFPNCGGAIDGKHIAIARPANSGSYYYNYKGYYSIVLVAIVDANYNFIMVDIGCNGRISDGSVIEGTQFYKRLTRQELNLPSRTETLEGLNFVFIGDSAFSLRPDLMKAFPTRTLTHSELIYNYRLSRAHRVVENALGILANRFRIFHTAISLSPEKVEDIVRACTVLHNYLRRNCGANYIPQTSLNREDLERCVLISGESQQDALPANSFVGLQMSPSDVSEGGQNVRNEYKNYFNQIGQVPWQDKMVL